MSEITYLVERGSATKTGRWRQQKKWIKRSSPLSDSRVVNHRGFERTRGVCRGLWVSNLGRHPPPGHPLIYHGRRPQLFTTNKRQAVWATCHRAFNCLFLSLFLSLPPSCSTIHTPLSCLLSLPLSSAPVPHFFVSPASLFSLLSPFLSSHFFFCFVFVISISIKLAVLPQSKKKKKTILSKHQDKRHIFTSNPFPYYISIFEHIFLCVCGSNSGGFRLPHIHFLYTNPAHAISLHGSHLHLL